MPREGQRGGEGGHSPDRTQTTAAACGALALAAVSCGADDMGWDRARRGAGNLWGAPVLIPQNVCVSGICPVKRVTAEAVGMSRHGVSGG